MDAKQYEKLKDMLCHELEMVNQRGSMNQNDIEKIFKITTSIKNIDKIQMMDDESGMSMYSNDGMRNSYGGTRGLMTYRGNVSYDGDRGYRDGSSYKRDSMGRYSRGNENLLITKEIDRMLSENDLTESERNTLTKALEIMRV